MAGLLRASLVALLLTVMTPANSPAFGGRSLSGFRGGPTYSYYFPAPVQMMYYPAWPVVVPAPVACFPAAALPIVPSAIPRPAPPSQTKEPPTDGPPSRAPAIKESRSLGGAYFAK